MEENIEFLEIWKTIEGYEGYEISNLARVRSKDRIVSFSNGVDHFYRSEIMKPAKSNGYLTIRLSNNKKIIRTQYIHRLIANTFLDKIEGKNCINHINGDRSDNRLENLEWCTYSESSIHAVEVLNKKSRSKKIGKYDLNDNLIEIYYTLKDAAEKNNLKDSNICNVCTHKVFKSKKKGKEYIYQNNTCGGFKWKYID